MRLKNCLGKTRLEFEKNLRSIEGVVPAPVKISVWEIYRISQRELAPAKAEVPQMKKKFVPGRTTDFKQRERLAEANTPSQTVAALTPAPTQKEKSGGPTKCFRCEKFSHFAQNCKSKNVITAVVPDNSGKDRG